MDKEVETRKERKKESKQVKTEKDTKKNISRQREPDIRRKSKKKRKKKSMTKNNNINRQATTNNLDTPMIDNKIQLFTGAETAKKEEEKILWLNNYL